MPVHLGLRGQHLFEYVYFQTWNWGLWSPPDRRFLTKEVLPFYRKGQFKNILFVGVHRYTKGYPKLMANSQFITIDIDPSLARFGAKKHICDSVLNISQYQNTHFPKGIDLIVFNGVIGFGLDKFEEVEEAFFQMAKVLNPKGHLIVGTNPKFISQESLKRIPVVQENFRVIPFADSGSSSFRFEPPLQKNAAHEYLFLCRRGSYEN